LDYREYREKAEKEVSAYFRHCPLCSVEGSMEFQWGVIKDTMTCLNCGAKWHINHGLTGFHWAKLIKDNAEGRGTELLGEKKDPRFWEQMGLNGFRLIKDAPAQVAREKEVIKEEPATTQEEKPWWWNSLKYFVHGLLFSVMFLVLTLAWTFLFAILILLGLFIGFIIGFIVLFLLIGGLNSVLADLMWDITVKTDWKNLLSHGFVLFIVLFIVDIPAIAINFIVPSLATTIVFLIVNAFIYGFAAKKTAGHWEEEYEEND